VEPLGGDAYRVTVADADAKAWRLSVAGAGARAGDRWDIAVETSDVAPSIVATEVVEGSVVDTMDLSGFADGTAAAGGCHSILPVCLDSSGFRLPDDGDGTFAVILHLSDPATALTVTASTAGWPADPFVLGPWITTDPFTWGA
ncbi:MAG: hypothetical protein WCK58_11260, partial [Chloroflexota bacterium]